MNDREFADVLQSAFVEALPSGKWRHKLRPHVVWSSKGHCIRHLAEEIKYRLLFKDTSNDRSEETYTDYK